MMQSRLALTLAWAICMGNPLAGAQNQTSRDGTAIDSLNHYREAMGLGRLTPNDLLTQTALAHRQYVSNVPDRSVFGLVTPDGIPYMHLQAPGSAFFSGVTLGERAKRQGYPYGVGEQGVTTDSKGRVLTGQYVVDQLMATVYHRSGLLKPGWTELGAAVGTHDAILVLGEGRVKGQVAADWLATYPMHRTTTARVAFKRELPDPAPERAGQWLGLPISIHAAVGSSLRVERFELRERVQPAEPTQATEIGSGALVAGRLLDATNDQLIGKHEAFFLPSMPLKYAATYEVTAEFGIRQKVSNLRWSFQTPEDPFAVIPTAAVTEVTPGVAQSLEIVGTQGAWSLETKATAPSQTHIPMSKSPDGKLTFSFPETCNASCGVTVVVQHSGPHPSTLQREFVVAKSWLASRTVDQVLPQSFLAIANDLSWQKSARALAYGNEGNQWFMSRSYGAASQTIADQKALQNCNKQALQLNSPIACKLYQFAIGRKK
ncbi:MAG: hypothetical protein K9K38_16710 [Rhodoferax sp.]|nr:hypothetical protein [Rhodoferax sp.]MCF8211021.1 hypothetical protein [Rhodoferax sp.]